MKASGFVSAWVAVQAGVREYTYILSLTPEPMASDKSLPICPVPRSTEKYQKFKKIMRALETQQKCVINV